MAELQATNTPGIRLAPLNPAGPPLVIEIDHTPPLHPHPRQSDINRTWETLRRDNPRLYNGPVLSVVSVDAHANRIRCRRDSFKNLAVQTAERVAPSVRTGVHQLSVTGAVVGRDRAGTPHILLGRRGTQTRLYGGMWELAPAGGVEYDGRADRLGADAVLRTLKAEAHEELGLDLPTDRAVLAAVCRDEHAASDDLIAIVPLPAPIDPAKPIACAAGGDWEYLDTSWLALADAPAFARDHEGAIIPPARVLLSDLRWLHTHI